MRNASEFRPDWASPPGATISDLMATFSWTRSDFADRLGETTLLVEELISGRALLTDELASKLAYVFSSSSDFWLSRENQYRASLANIEEIREWLSALPETYMQKRGIIRKGKHLSERASILLDFFGSSSVDEWKVEHSGKNRLAAFRTSPKLESDEGATLVWLRQGEHAADEIDCSKWNLRGFESSLKNIRNLTLEKNPGIFIPKLQKICADNGVIVSIIRTPPGCRASGSARFLSNGNPQILLSFRHLSDDHFWFTFFHEAAHLILHSKSGLFLDGLDNETRDRKEIEANAYASDLLIPEEFLQELESLPLMYRPVMRFARKIRIAPGIVVGQLQFRKICPQNRLNKLKTRYRWE